MAKFYETQVNRAVKRQVLMTPAVHFECFVIKPLESSINSYFVRFRGQQFRWKRPSSSRSTGNFQGKTLPKCSKISRLDRVTGRCLWVSGASERPDGGAEREMDCEGRELSLVSVTRTGGSVLLSADRSTCCVPSYLLTKQVRGTSASQ